MSTSAYGSEGGVGPSLSNPMRALYEDFWSRFTAGEDLEGEPALKLAESWQNAAELARCLGGEYLENWDVLSKMTQRARASFESGGPAAWVHLLVACKQLSLPVTSITLESDRFQLLLDAATFCMHADTAIRSADEARSRFRAIEALIDTEDNWRAPSQSALLLHALNRIASLYRSQLEGRARSWLASLLASLLRVVFVSHRHFWAELNHWSANQETPLAELSDELTRIDALKASGRKLQDRLRQEVRNMQLEDESPSALTDVLDSILNSISGQSKSSNLSQHTLLAVYSESGHNPDWMPYRERLQRLAPLEHWVLDKEYGWRSERPRNWHTFAKLLEKAFGRGWPRDYLSSIFPSLTGLDTHSPVRRHGSLSDTAWTLDGEFSFLVILMWRMQRTNTNGSCSDIALTERQLLPSFAKEGASNEEVHWLPADLETLLAKSLGLFDENDDATIRFWSFYNFLEHEALRSNRMKACCESCAFRTSIEELYTSILRIEGPPSGTEFRRILELLDLPSCCKTADHVVQHSRLESLLLEILLREGRRLPTTLFLMPLLRAEWPNQGHYPLAIYAGTLMGLESDHWPHVTARANAHLSAIYDSIQPVIELMVAQVLVEYVSHLRQARDILQDATVQFLQDLDGVDIFDRSLPVKTKDLIGMQLLKTMAEFSTRRSKRLSDMGVRLTVAMAAALGEEDGGEEIYQRLLERLRTIVQDVIADGGLSSAWILEALNGFRRDGDIQALMSARVSGAGSLVKMKDFFGSFKRRLMNPKTRSISIRTLENLVLRPAWELGRFLERTPEVVHLSPLVTSEQKDRLKEKVNQAWRDFPSILKDQGPGRVVERIKNAIDADQWERAAAIWSPMRVDTSNRLISKLQEWVENCNPCICTLRTMSSDEDLIIKDAGGSIETEELIGRSIFPQNVILPCPHLDLGDGHLVDAVNLLLTNRCEQSQKFSEVYSMAMGWNNSEYFYLRLHYEHPSKGAFNRLLSQLSEPENDERNSTEWRTKTVPLWRLLGPWISIDLTVNSRVYNLEKGWLDESVSDQVSIEFRLMAYQKLGNEQHGISSEVSQHEE